MIPQTLRARLLLLIILIIALPVSISGYFLTVTAEKTLLAEKERKLFGAAIMLDNALAGTYQDILNKYDVANSPKTIKVAVLNRELREITDQVASAYPGIGVGYYSKELDAILTYGPSHTYGDTVGTAISESHQGRIVMATGEPRVQEGYLVRGMIMNAMYPVIRDNQVIGYIWANEMTADIRQQIGEMNKKIFFLILMGLIVGIAGVFHVVDRIMADVDKIKAGLWRIRGNFPTSLPLMPGEIGEIAAAINDLVTHLAEKKRLEEQVQHAERLAAAGEIAASLAHEIRNPLMAIKGFTQLLNESHEQEEIAEYTGIIIKETDRMNRLIEQLLCLARPAADSQTTVPVDVTMTLESALQLVETQARRRHIDIRRVYDEVIPFVMADSENLKQVFLNIMINAIQVMEADGGVMTITAKYSFEERLVLISIADTGIGISAENIGKLFDPFFTTKEKGTGLGLSVAQRFIRNWGGDISVESTLGSGSVFSISLPEAGGLADENQSTNC